MECSLMREQISRLLRSRHGEHGRTLNVDVENGQLVLRGCAASFYQKQLWLHGALLVAGPGRIVDHIDVAN